MEIEHIIKYLTDNLEIRIDQAQDFGPEEIIKISLELGGNIISEDFCSLPKLEE
jgi:hypothetical protein